MIDRVVLPGLDPYLVAEAMFEGLRVLLSYRGEPYTPAYIQGLGRGLRRRRAVRLCSHMRADDRAGGAGAGARL